MGVRRIVFTIHQNQTTFDATTFIEEAHQRWSQFFTATHKPEGNPIDVHATIFFPHAPTLLIYHFRDNDMVSMMGSRSSRQKLRHGSGQPTRVRTSSCGTPTTPSAGTLSSHPASHHKRSWTIGSTTTSTTPTSSTPSTFISAGYYGNSLHTITRTERSADSTPYTAAHRRHRFPEPNTRPPPTGTCREKEPDERHYYSFNLPLRDHLPASTLRVLTAVANGEPADPGDLDELSHTPRHYLRDPSRLLPPTRCRCPPHDRHRRRSGDGQRRILPIMGVVGTR